MIRRTRFFFFLFFVFGLIFLPLISQSLALDNPTQPLLLTSTNYLSVVESALNSATKSIDIVMYLIQLERPVKEDPVQRLLAALVQAQSRGVKISVIMEGSHRGQNLAAYEYLAANQVPVFFDTNSKFIHEKTIVIDAQTVIIGSQNWSDVSITSNLETAVLINSPQLASQTLAEINKIELLQRIEPSVGQNTGVLLPYDFFFHHVNGRPIPGQPGPGAALLSNNVAKAFDLYLILLRNSQAVIPPSVIPAPAGIQASITPDLSAWSRELSLSTPALKDQLDLLARKYHLISYPPKTPIAQTTITLLDPADSSRPFSAGTFHISLSQDYWQYGWDRRLPLRAKYAYLINLVELDRSYGLPSWFRSQEDIGKIYGIYPDTFGLGILDLRRWNLVEVQSDLAPEGAPYDERLANYYLLKPFYSLNDFNRSLSDLEAKYGKSTIAQSRKLSEQLEEGYDLTVIEKFAQLIQQFGLVKVQAANDETARLRLNNAKRNIDNTILLLGPSN